MNIEVKLRFAKTAKKPALPNPGFCAAGVCFMRTGVKIVLCTRYYVPDKRLFIYSSVVIRRFDWWIRPQSPGSLPFHRQTKDPTCSFSLRLLGPIQQHVAVLLLLLPIPFRTYYTIASSRSPHHAVPTAPENHRRRPRSVRWDYLLPDRTFPFFYFPRIRH